MTTSIDQIRAYNANFMDAPDEVKERYPNSLFLAIPTERYINPDGQRILLVIVSVLEDGNYVRLEVPRVLHLEAHEHFEAELYQLLLFLCFVTAIVQADYQPHGDSGVINASVEVPVMDSTFTQLQFQRCVIELVRFAENFYYFLNRVRNTGQGRSRDDLDRAYFEEMLAMRRRMDNGEGPAA